MDMQDDVYLINRTLNKKIFIFSENELNDNYQEIYENSEWNLIFRASEDTKLYMDGLDLISDKRIIEDKNGMYITPSEEPYYI